MVGTAPPEMIIESMVGEAVINMAMAEDITVTVDLIMTEEPKA